MIHRQQLLTLILIAIPTLLPAGSVSISINQPVTIQSSTMLPTAPIEPLITRVRTAPDNARFFARMMIAPLLAGVAGITWYHSSMSRWLQDPARWCCWKQEVRLSALKEMPAPTVIQELIHDTELRYNDKEGCPLTHLILDLTAEHRILERYRVYVCCYRWMRLALIAPRALVKVDEALERLSYIESLVHQGYRMATSQITSHA